MRPRAMAHRCVLPRPPLRRRRATHTHARHPPSPPPRNSAGAYAGFDAAEPTSRDGGKAEVLRGLVAAHGYAPLLMVGDGVTDMQARPPADAFIGFGGVVVRPPVRDGADLFVTSWDPLLAALRG